MAAKDMGLAEVPVVVLDHLNEAQRRAYVIADNKLALNASWDIDLLALEVDALRVEDFDIELLGFSEEELKGLTENGWATDIEAVEKHEENLDGIQAKIVVKLDGTYKDEVLDAIRMYCDSHAISAEIS
jgi:ParB-like chromosome segregation protein Spo0J